MKQKYEKENIIEEKNEDEKNQEIMDTILQTKKVLSEASINYEHAEGKLIDYFLYTIKAEQARLEYLIDRAKSIGMTVNIGEQINSKNA